MLPDNAPLQSSFRSIAWPTIPSPQAAAHLAMQYQLEQSQWLEEQDIRRRQLLQLRPLYSHAAQHVPFYQQHLNALPCDQLAPISWEQWQAIPLLTRNDLQQAGDSIVSTSLPPGHGKPFPTATSGSTGKPVTVWHNDIITFFWLAFTLREHMWHQRDVAGKRASIRYTGGNNADPPSGLQFKSWGAPTAILFKAGPSCILDIKTPLDEQAAWLVREQPDYLLTHPTNAHALAHHFKQSSERLHNLKEVRTLAETLTAETVALCKEVWGVEVTDMYSTKEVGYIALQCPEQRTYHVQAENVLVEILREDGTPCRPGEVGKVVITSLHNYASPIIRYDIGDYAEVGTPCACGRGLPVINKIMGRVRNILTLPSGIKHWPVFNYPGLEAVVPFRQIQVLQHTPDSLEVRLVVEKKVSHDQEKQMKTIIQDALHFPFAVTFSYHDEIPRTRGGKFEEFISFVS
ncbi:MAG: phenylacetate--CoA ligase family protein [Deltaproteobacteria bacterium]|nr:phenylacetate--CoA ligase family protein [Candidatus Anaeroferrophillus wilburensis]MBN2887902.1 phenylacetate--CoA ligase family protein [Deltaproteobacteria bacterium]